MSDPSSSVEPDQLRAEFVENARRFFINDKVRATPLEEQKKFLLSKGVSEAEVEAALAKIPTNQLAANQTPLPQPVQVVQPPPHGLISAAQSILVIGGASYLAYKFVRSWVLPKFFDIADPADKDRLELKTQLNELQNTTKFVMDTVSQTLETVATQQEQLNRALNLLSNQSGKANQNGRKNSIKDEIPAWQRNDNVMASSTNSDQIKELHSNGTSNLIPASE